MSTSVPARSPAGRPPRRRWSDRGWPMLLVFLAIAFAVAAFGSVTTVGAVDGWYARVPHVAWTPPNWAFGVVWSVLYTLIALAGWLVWLERRRVDTRVALGCYVAQFVLNALWAPVFFGGYLAVGLPALWTALVLILLLDLLVAATIALFWPISRPAAVLLVPYLLWILYASSLSWGDTVLLSLG